MARRRSDFGDGGVPAKRQKISTEPTDPKSNPYLAHMYESPETNGYNNGYNTPSRRMNGAMQNGPLAQFQRHKTTATMAMSAATPTTTTILSVDADGSVVGLSG